MLPFLIKTALLVSTSFVSIIDMDLLYHNLFRVSTPCCLMLVVLYSRTSVPCKFLERYYLVLFWFEYIRVSEPYVHISCGS